MLVLARVQGQSVVLDDRITVTVLGAKGGLVRLGIEAPAEVGVRRGELTPHEASEDRPPPGAPPADASPAGAR